MVVNISRHIPIWAELRRSSGEGVPVPFATISFGMTNQRWMFCHEIRLNLRRFQFFNRILKGGGLVIPLIFPNPYRVPQLPPSPWTPPPALRTLQFLLAFFLPFKASTHRNRRRNSQIENSGDRRELHKSMLCSAGSLGQKKPETTWLRTTPWKGGNSNYSWWFRANWKILVKFDHFSK